MTRGGRTTTIGSKSRKAATAEDFDVPGRESCGKILVFLFTIVLGVLQGVTELFPVSSLGHSVILPQLLGWNDVVAAQSASESYFLAFLVGLHVATALALLFFYRSTWARIGGGLVASMRTRRIEAPEQRLGWLLVVATIPAALAGLFLEHTLRVVFARPLAAAAGVTLGAIRSVSDTAGVYAGDFSKSVAVARLGGFLLGTPYTQPSSAQYTFNLSVAFAGNQ